MRLVISMIDVWLHCIQIISVRCNISLLVFKVFIFGRIETASFSMKEARRFTQFKWDIAAKEIMLQSKLASGIRLLQHNGEEKLARQRPGYNERSFFLLKTKRKAVR